jgi:hypothetical protein
MPSFGVLARALRVTTERLAREISAPGDTAPDWSEFEWDVARAAAAMQGITVLLANRLRWRGPQSWQAFLAIQSRQAVTREAQIAALLARIDGALRTAGVGCVALKGAALHSLGIYGAGERPMGDVDLLIRSEQLARVAQALHSIGYASAFRTRRHDVFEPRDKPATSRFGEHPDNPLKIELHEVIAEPLPWRPVDITTSMWSGASEPGLRGYPSARELMRHLLLHAAGNIRAHALRQVQLHDIALLSSRLVPGDWIELLRTAQSRGGAWWMWPVLELTMRYYPGALAQQVAGFRRACPWLLRQASARTTLTQVSWSNLRIAALPGVCWSRTPLDAWNFARSRVAPDREARDELATAHATIAQLQEVRWYGESHRARILRWLFGRPPRVQTLATVRAALAARDDAQISGA